VTFSPDKAPCTKCRRPTLMGLNNRLRPDLCFRCYTLAVRDGELDQDLPLFAARTTKEKENDAPRDR
jgi:hypothetical protein